MRNRMTSKQIENKDGLVSLNLYRCTRGTPYQADCPGRTDVTSRQGYYISAPNADSALLKMRIMFMEDQHDFTCELWRENIHAGH